MDGAVGWPAGCDTAWRPTYKALSRNPPIVAGEVTSALMRVTSLDTQRACVELKTAGTRHAAAYLHSDLGYRLVDDLVCRPLLWIATRDDRSGNRGAGTSSTFEEFRISTQRVPLQRPCGLSMFLKIISTAPGFKCN